MTSKFFRDCSNNSGQRSSRLHQMLLWRITWSIAEKTYIQKACWKEVYVKNWGTWVGILTKNTISGFVNLYGTNMWDVQPIRYTFSSWIFREKAKKISQMLGDFFQIFVAFSEYMNFMQIFTLILVCLMKNWYEFCRYKTCYAALQVQICQPKSLFIQHASLMYIVQILLGAFWRACLFCFCVCKSQNI